MANGGVGEVELGTDETFDLLCSVCSEKNQNTEAEKFCLQCQDYYCFTCSVKFHDETPSMKTHNILDRRQFWSGSRAALPSEKYEKCYTHRNKTVDIYCKQCDTLGCLDCMLEKHSSCKDEFCVLHNIESSTIVSSTKETTEKLAAIANKLGKLRNAFMNEKEKIKSSKKLPLEQIKKFRIDINQTLDEMERDTVKELEETVQSLLNMTEDKLRALEAQTTHVQSAQDNLASSGGNMAQIFTSIKMANDVAYQAKQIVSTTQVSSTEVFFAAEQKLLSWCIEQRLLGYIRLVKTPKYQPLSPSLIQLPESLPQSPVPLESSKLKITGRQRYMVNVPSEKYACDLTSVCTLPDGTIILADFLNNNLKRLDCSYAVKDCCDLPDSPWQVCAIGNQEAAVSCYKIQAIQFVFVGEKMERARRMDFDFQCFGLAYGDDKLYITDKTSVYVYTIWGERLEQFKWDKSQQGILSYIVWPNLFSDIVYIAVSSDNSKIYIADIEKGLIILDENGFIVGEYNGPELQAARGVCLYKNDSILVCGKESKNVVQFCTDGTLMGEVLERNFKTVFCHANNSKLIIGSYISSTIEICEVSGE